MKKLLLIGALGMMSAGIYASVSVRLSCGKVVQTVSKNYKGFHSNTEYEDWLNDLDEVYCGSKTSKAPAPLN